MTINIGKKFSITAVVLLIIAVVYNVIFFVIPWRLETSAGAFWVTYAFTWIALILVAIVSYIAFNKKDLKSMIFGLPIFSVGIVFLIVQIVIDTVILGVGSYFEIKYWIPLVVEIVILGIALLCIVARKNNRDYIESIDKKDYKESYIKELRIDLEVIYNENKIDSIKAQLGKLLETAKYTDPVSCKEIVDVEDQIEMKLSELKKAVSDGNGDEAAKLIDTISNLLKERKLRARSAR